MNFASLPAGAIVFLDANVFVYAYAGDPSFGSACTDLLERIELRQLQGVISTQVFSDVSHRLMTLVACQTFGWNYTGIGRRLRSHPGEIQKLFQFRESLDDIVTIGVRIVPVSAQDVLAAGNLCQKHGLLSGDALIVAIMQANSLTNLTSNDADFDRVPGITRFSPI